MNYADYTTSRRTWRRRPTSQRAFCTYLTLSASLLLACGTSTSTPATSTLDAALFEVFPDRPRQTISHLASGNFNHRFGRSTTDTEPVSELNLATFQPRFARVAMDLGNWEPDNDNNDPLQIDPSRFVDAEYNHATFEFLKRYRDQGVEYIANAWYVPDWMVENPRASQQRIIDPSLYPEVIESIAAWLLRAKETYGVDISFCSFNEPNLGFYQLLSSDDSVQLIRMGGQRFAELGLQTKWLLGDCYEIGGCLDFVKPIWNVDDIRPYLGPLAVHNYDADTNLDEVLTQLGDWAAEQGLETRVTEGGWDGELTRRASIFPTWTHAHQLMLAYNRTIKMTRATTFYYWEMMGEDYHLNDGISPYMAMQVLQQLDRAFPPGSQVVETSSNTRGIALFAAHTPSGFGVHLVTESLTEDDPPTDVVIQGLPPGDYQLHLSQDGTIDRVVQTLTATRGTIGFALPSSSVAYLVGSSN